MTLTAAGALAAEARPADPDGQKTSRPRVVSDRYTDGFAGTVTTQTCYCITLPDGSSYLSRH